MKFMQLKTTDYLINLNPRLMLSSLLVAFDELVVMMFKKMMHLYFNRPPLSWDVAYIVFESTSRRS